MSAADYNYDVDQFDPPHQPLYLAKLLRHLRDGHEIHTVLDAGCGDGNFTASLAEGGFEMYGIDLSPRGIVSAQQSWPAIHFAKASVYDDLRAIFPTVDAFDAILSIEVIEHLYSPRAYMERVVEALRPGGLLILTTPYWGYLKNVVLAVTNRTDRSLTVLWEGGHIKHWSYRTLRTLGERQGLEFVKFEGAGRGIPFLWNGMVMVFRKPLDSSEHSRAGTNGQ